MGQLVGTEFRVNTTTSGLIVDPAIASSSSGFVVVWQDGFTTDAEVLGQRFNPSGVPVGSEFRVNSYTTTAQTKPSIAADSAGNFVVVWQSSQLPGGYYGIFGRRFSGTGAPVGAEFRVSTLAVAGEAWPRVAASSAGGFMVVWQAYFSFAPIKSSVFAQRFGASGERLGSEFRVSSNAAVIVQYAPVVASGGAGDFIVAWPGNVAGDVDVYARRFGSSGAPLGTDFRVNTLTSGPQNSPAVSADSSGQFVIAWGGYTDGSNDEGIFAQVFAASGAPVGSQLRVNTYTTDSQRWPSVGIDASGRFVVVWMSKRDNGATFDRPGIFARPFDRNGTALEGEFRVSTYTTGMQYRPAVATDGSGFVVVWQSHPEGTDYGIFGRHLILPPPREGDEFRINTYTTRFQFSPEIAMSSSGDFVVVWESYRDGGGLLDEFGIFGQRYDRTGAALGTEFRVNTYTTGNQELPRAALDGSGAFVVVWTSYGGEDRSGAGIFARRYSSSGAALGDQFQVNTFTTGAQLGGAVSSDSVGNTVVVWASDKEDGSSYGVYAQLFTATAATGDEFRVNTYTSNAQRAPWVASSAAGSFVVVWQSDGADGSGLGISGQRYASGGGAVGGEFRVNDTTTGSQYAPRVASDAAGNFVVVWAAANGPVFTIMGRRYASSGASLGSEFVVSQFSDLDQRLPTLSMSPDGDFAVAWSDPSDGSGKGVSAVRYAANGQPVGADFQVNTFTAYDQTQPSIALGPSLVVVWSSYPGQDGDFSGIFGQRYRPCVSSDMNGDGKTDVADVFYLINALFASGPAPVCGGDVNGDVQTDVADVFYLINFLFAGGPPPV